MQYNIQFEILLNYYTTFQTNGNILEYYLVSIHFINILSYYLEYSIVEPGGISTRA